MSNPDYQTTPKEVKEQRERLAASFESLKNELKKYPIQVRDCPELRHLNAQIGSMLWKQYKDGYPVDDQDAQVV